MPGVGFCFWYIEISLSQFSTRDKEQEQLRKFNVFLHSPARELNCLGSQDLEVSEVRGGGLGGWGNWGFGGLCVGEGRIKLEFCK